MRENPLIFLAGYQGLTAAANDPADSHALAVLQSAYQTLVAVATAIETGTLRHSLLENVPANYDLLALCQQYFAQGVPDAPVDLAALNARCLAGWLLAGADLNRPQMQATDLQGADLRGADLRKSDPSGANLQGADLYGSAWRAADHYGAYLATAMTDEQTLRPTDVFNGTTPGSSAERG